MSNLVPIEFKKQRIMTTKVLAEQFGTEEKNIQMNFSRNESRFTEGKHFLKLEGESLKSFKNSLPTESREPIKFAPILYLWTEKGVARHAKILDTDEAWEIYEELEETYFRVKNQELNLIQLSPELQAFKAIFDSMAKQENETNTLMKKICYKLSDYKKPKEQLYKALQERARCDLKIRLKNMRGRLALEGATKTKIDNLNYLDVIAEDNKLIEIYTAIIKEMSIKYKIA